MFISNYNCASVQPDLVSHHNFTFAGAPSKEYVNFAKRWQQFNILDNMRRFKQSHIDHNNKNEKILAFFNSFQECLDEEELWQISESIKPRGGRKL